MAYQLVNSRGSEFAVDWEVLERLCRSYWTNSYQLQLATTVEMSGSSWYNPFSWKMPASSTVDVPWEKVRGSAAADTIKDMFRFGARAPSDMFAVANEMASRIDMTRLYKRRFVDLLRDAQASNADELARAEAGYTGLVEAAQFVRDTSADVVIIGSTIATGGAATGLLVGGSTLKGIGKYQDTDSVGAAVITGAGNIVLGAFKIGGAKLGTGAEYALIVAKGTLDTTTSLVAGDSFATAVQKGGIKIASASGAQALFSAEWVKKVFERMPIPFNVMSIKSQDGVNIMNSDVSNKLGEKFAKKITEEGIKKGLKKTLTSSSSNGSSGPPGIAELAPLDDSALLSLAIVNMKKGIGRGW